jgi:hypothetical protein
MLLTPFNSRCELILDAEKTIGGEGMSSLLRVILFATRNYTAVFQGTYKGLKKIEGGATTSVKNSCCISVLPGHSVGPARGEAAV